MKKIKYVCSECGSDQVTVETLAWWNEGKQTFDYEIMDGGHYCEKCDGPCNIEEIEIQLDFEPIDWIMDGTDWDLLSRQKLALLHALDVLKYNDTAFDGLNSEMTQSESHSGLMGILHWIDDIQDYANGVGLWKFPESEDNQ